MTEDCKYADGRVLVVIKRKARALHEQMQVTAGCRTEALSQFSG